MIEIAPSVGDDIIDFYEGRGVYHTPVWDGFQHHLAERQFTTRDLCLEVKSILEKLPLLTYLDGADWMIVRHFIRWFTQDPDTPYMIWVDNDEETGKRIFFYESVKGVFRRFNVGAGMSIPKESLRASQVALEGEEESQTGHIHIQLELCQLGSCGKPSTHRIPVKAKSGTTTSFDVCEEHFEKIEAQRKTLDAEKERKRIERAEKSKYKVKAVRKKEIKKPEDASPHLI